MPEPSAGEHSLSPADLLRAEEAAWEELEDLVEPLSPEQAEVPGYLPGWSVKDFLAHLAGWLSAAGQALEQIRAGTFTEDDADVDARNDTFVEANRDEPLSMVRFELLAARRRLLHHLHGLSRIPPAAEGPLRKAGPGHYAQHLPRLREWVAELRSEQAPPQSTREDLSQ